MDSKIAQRADVATLGSTMNVIFTVNRPGLARIEREHPLVEEIEQGATRVRPLFLEREEVHHMKVLKALGLLSKDAGPPHTEVVKQLRQAWKDFPTSSRWGLAVASAADDAGEAPFRSDRAIAWDWLYGDLLHADPDRRQRLRHVPESERIMAGLLWVKDAVLLTMATQHLITDLEEAGGLRSP